MQQHYLPHPKGCKSCPGFISVSVIHFGKKQLKGERTYVPPQPLVTEDYFGEVKAASHHTSLKKGKETNA